MHASSASAPSASGTDCVRVASTIRWFQLPWMKVAASSSAGNALSSTHARRSQRTSARPAPISAVAPPWMMSDAGTRGIIVSQKALMPPMP